MKPLALLALAVALEAGFLFTVTAPAAGRTAAAPARAPAALRVPAEAAIAPVAGAVRS
jgi:hypothetical protein